MTLPSFCKSCGERLGAMDRDYCPAPRCQERARADAMRARRPRILDDFEYDAGGMPKERLLALLAEDAKKYGCDPSGEAVSDLGHMTDFVLLTEKVKKHPWDDCAKFLAEREEIKRKIEGARRKARAETRSKSIPFAGGRFESAPIAARSRPYSTFGGSYEGTVPDRYGLDARPPQAVFEDAIKFGPVVIDSDETRVFQAAPQAYFQGTHLLVSPRIAPVFVLCDLRVGTMSQFSFGPIPMTAFTEYAVGITLGIDAVTPGILLTLMVRNISPSPSTFEAFLRGKVMR
jgi:hypothetical protein